MARTAGTARLRAWPAPLVAVLAGELRPMLSLALPVVIAEVGWMSMGLVDTMMVGRVSAEAIGAVAVGSHLFFSTAIFGLGILLGLDYLVSNARGRDAMGDAHHSLVQSIHLSLALAVVLSGVLWLLSGRLDIFGVDPAVLQEAQGYTAIVTLSLLPQLLYACFRRYLQALELMRAITFSVIVANLLNALVNWLLIFGNLGLPALGAEGAAWATVLSRWYVLGHLAVFTLRYSARHDPTFFSVAIRPDWHALRRLVALGFPAAAQTTLEVGVFTAATMLAAGLDPTSLAAHQIALQAASLSFMVPLGISSAGAVRVGLAIGRGDRPAARRAGWAALFLGATFMGFAAICFVGLPGAIARAFTDEVAVIATGAALIRIAAIFQLFDGLQVVATGILRGTGDTRTAMLTSLVCFWLVALPVGWIACFPLGGGVRGLWIGLCLGLILVALTLVTVWTRRMRS